MHNLAQLARLLRRRNSIDDQITKLIGRPASTGHLGEFIASKVFDIRLHGSASQKGSDGHFTRGPLAGRSVNVKFYPTHQGLLDISPDVRPDFYLVLAGPHTAPVFSRGQSRLCTIEFVYIFDGAVLAAELEARGVKLGVATSVRKDLWTEEISFG